MILAFCGGDYLLAPEVLRYAKLRAKYELLAADEEKKFLEEFNLNFKDLDSLVMNWEVTVSQITTKAIDSAISDLIDYDIFDIGKTAFIRDFFSKYDDHAQAFEEIKNNYDCIEFEQSSNALNKSHNPGGGGVIGGGFGLEGMAQGIAISTVANVAISAVSGVGNWASGIASSIKADRSKKNLFTNKNIHSYLGLVINNIVFSTHYAVIDAVESKRPESLIFKHPSITDIERSESILENCQGGQIAFDRQKEILATALILNPYNIELYSYFLKNFGDSNLELLSFYNSHDLADLDRIKTEILIHELDKSDLSSDFACNSAIQKAKEKSIFLGLKEPENLIKHIEGVRDFLNLKSEIEEAALPSSQPVSRTQKSTTPTHQSLKTKNEIELKELFGNILSAESSYKKIEVPEWIDAFLATVKYLFIDLNVINIFSRKGLVITYPGSALPALKAVATALNSLKFKFDPNEFSLTSRESLSGGESISITANRNLFGTKVRANIRIKCSPDNKTCMIEVLVGYSDGIIWQGLIHSRIRRAIESHK